MKIISATIILAIKMLAMANKIIDNFSYNNNQVTEINVIEDVNKCYKDFEVIFGLNQKG
jgi:hypothetical protein